MVKISGYQIHHKIHESLNSQVYRGVRQQDGLPIILKILKKDSPTPEEITRYKQEYEITRSLSLPGVIQAYRLEQYQSTFVIILEDFGGESLANIIATKKFSLTEFLQLSIQITDSLSDIHSAKIIHKDINPSNIVFNLQTQQLKIIDFGIATTLCRETLTLKHPRVLEGTLAYISPEQTGRMNRSLDYRTDFYSLGATFYQLLTNRIPFVSSDPLELIHYHLALEPIAPHVIQSEIPVVISDIILKLLAKTAEQRYQSAWGIKADLEQCLVQLKNSGSIEPFLLGQEDITDRFSISEKLYGREPEVKTLLEAFARVAGEKNSESNTLESEKVISRHSGSIELMLIAGYSGIGKSVLVQEIYQPITKQRGYFVAGKFDQYQRDIPYFAIAQALGSLIKQLLSEDTERLTQWREQLLVALGANSRVITQVIPALELIVGEQPDLPVLPPTEAQNRFQQVFQNFIRVFSCQENPLVIFLDDLQWADNASLKLIQLLATTMEERSLLLIGAYRDNEVNAAHPLMQMVAEIRQEGGVVNQITLSALNLADINQLIADTLHCSLADCLPLAELVQLKTGGNPFFMNEFLKSLYDEGLLQFHRPTKTWQWSIAQIQNQGITDNVVELMAQKIQKLHAKTQQVLQLSACIGNLFDLETLGLASELSQTEIAQTLEVAIAEGLILSLSNTHKSLVFDVPLENCPPVEYKFVHDRIQQATYSLIPEPKRRMIHLQLGQSLLQNTPAAQREQKIFDITNQLNLGQTLIQQQSERDELAVLNYLAGTKASASAAYNSALQYFQTGLALLTEDCWQRQYDLSLKLYIKTTEAEYLNIHFDQANILVDIALSNTANLLDRVTVYELQIQICMAQLELVKAIEIGLQVLEQLGISLVILAETESLLIELPSLTALSVMPVMSNPYMLCAMQILKTLCSPVFMAKPEIFPQIIMTMINLCLEHGNSPLSAFGFGFYGLLLSGTGRVEEGYHAGKIALELLEIFKTKELTAKVYNLFNSNIRAWKEHARNSIAPLKTAVQMGLETGDIEWGGYAAANLCSYLFLCEGNLASTLEQQAIYVELSIKIQQENPTHFTQIWRQLGLNLRGLAEDKYRLIGESFDETHMLPRLIAAKSGTVLYIFYVAKTILLYHLGEYDQALKQAQLAQQEAGAAFGFIQVAILNFYHSLALLADYSQLDPSDRQTYLQQVDTNQKQMQFWAYHAPMNYLHKWHLVEAERYRLLGQRLEAMDAYDRAIALANEHEYLQEEALANELAGKFYLAQDQTTIAKAYLQAAKYGYLRWGATAKVQDLQRQYPPLLELQSPSTPIRQLDMTQSASTKLEALDLETVLKASQAIASEIVLDQLLAKLMTILIENAGAQTGYLILPTADEWRVEAIASIGEAKVSLSSMPLVLADNHAELPTAVINYVARTQESVVLDHATQVGNFQSEPWIIQHQVKSLLCAPLLHQGKLTGIVLLVNNLTTNAFTSERLEILNFLLNQAAISLDNARLWQQQADMNLSLQAEIAEREKVEISLRQSEQRFASLAIVAPVGIFRTDAAGNCLYVNERWCLIAGMNPDTAMGKGWINSLHPDDREIVASEWHQAAQLQRPFQLEYRFQRSDGAVSWVFGQAVAEYDAHGSVKGYVGTITDISDRKKAEQERDRLIAILQASTDCIGMSTPEGIVLWNNAQANQLRGLPPEADVSSLRIPDYHPQWALEIILNQGIPTAMRDGIWVGETAVFDVGHQEIPVSQMIIAHKAADGSLEYFSTIMRDISEAKHREAEIKRAETTLQNLVAGTSAVTGADFFPALVRHIAEALEVSYALVTQLVNGELQALAFWANGTLQPQIRYFPARTPCEFALQNGLFYCQTLVQQMFPEDLDLVTMQADSYLGISLKNAQGEPIGNLCILDVRPLKDIKRIEVILDVFAARAAAELERQAALADLYQLNQSLENRVKQRTAQLEAANKELESFSYSVSHDLRAPLRAIVGFARMMQEDYGEQLAEANRYLDVIRDNAKHMGQLIDDLLSLSRMNRQELHRQPVSPNQLIDEVLSILVLDLEGREIEWAIAKLPICQADISLLKQVWMNLLSNAIKYTRYKSPASIQIDYQIIDGEGVYFICDNGAGFDMRYADNLFGVFQRLHRPQEFEGTGVGLATVQRIIQRHGGRIWAKAAVNQGATFYFTLPDQLT